MSFPYYLDLAYGSELYTSDTYLTVSLGKKDPGPEPPGPQPDHYTVSWPLDETYSINPDGFTPTLSDNTYSIRVEDQSTLSFTIAPSEGYSLTSYTVDGNTIENPEGSAVTDSIQITKDISISASTQSIIVSYTITLSADNNIKSMSKSAGEYSVNQGESFEVVVEPKDGYTLSATCSDSSMTESAGSTPNSKVYTIPSVTKDCTLSIVGEASGIEVDIPDVDNVIVQTITESPVESGSNFIFRVTPNEGYILGDVIVDGITLTGTLVENTPDTMEYTITNITRTPNVVIEGPSVDEMKFYSGKQRAYIPSTGEEITGYFKLDLNTIENQNDKEDLSKILPQLELVLDNFYYSNNSSPATIVFSSNIDNVISELSSVLHSTSWSIRPTPGNTDGDIYSNLVYLRNGSQEYPIVFCSNKIDYTTDSLLFYGNRHIDFEKNEEVGRYDGSTGYVYDKRGDGDIDDADMSYSVLELKFSNMGDSILHPNIIYSNGIRVFDRDSNTMCYGQYRIDLSEESSETRELYIQKLRNLQIVIDQYFYSSDYSSKMIPEYSISTVSSNDTRVYIDEIMGLNIEIRDDNGVIHNISAGFYVNGVKTEYVSDRCRYELYYVNDSDKSPSQMNWVGGESNCNNRYENGYVFDRTNEDLLIGNNRDTIRYGSHGEASSDADSNTGIGQSAITISFLV